VRELECLEKNFHFSWILRTSDSPYSAQQTLRKLLN
jgi:hypothetical protein